MAYLTRQQALDIINKAPSNLNKEVLLQELAKNNTIEGYNEVAKKTNVLQTLGREIAKPFVQATEVLGQGARTFGQVAKAGVQSITDKEKARQTLDTEAQRLTQSRQGNIPLMGGEVARVQTGKQAVGTALNLASNLVGGGGAVRAGGIALKTGLKSAITTGAKIGAKAGTLYGGGEALSEDKNVLGGAALGALGGAVGGAALPAVGSALVGSAKVLASPFSTVIERLVPTLDKVANKIETVVAKPSKADLARGFKVENIFKYDLGGPLGQSLEKSEIKIAELVAKADALRGQSKAVIDLNKIVQDVAKDLDTASISTVGNNQKILNAFKTWVVELENTAPTGKISTVEAQKIKVALGKMGSWLNGQRDLDSTAMENVSNVLYTRVKEAIEKSVGDPAELKAINKQLSELIPINNVLIKRIPIAERNASLSLTDIITAGVGTIDPKAWGLFVINRLSKSARFANLINKASQKLKSGAEKLLPLENKVKVNLQNIKPGLSIEDVSKKPLKSDLSSSISKAKGEGKTFEEWVKSYSLYHGTPNELEGGVLKFGAGKQLKKGGYMGGHFLTDTPQIAENFSFGGKVYQASGEIKNKVLDVNKSKQLFKDFIGKKYKTDGELIEFTQQEFDSIFPNGKADWSTINTDLVEQLAKKQGKIGVAIPEYAGGKQGMTYQLFEDNIPVYSKSQLISEWNKAQKLK